MLFDIDVIMLLIVAIKTNVSSLTLKHCHKLNKDFYFKNWRILEVYTIMRLIRSFEQKIYTYDLL